jgi:hypothetical protein
MHNSALIDWIRQASVKAELVLSVCTGALLLAKAGLLDGLVATMHHGAIDLLRQTAPKATVDAGMQRFFYLDCAFDEIDSLVWSSRPQNGQNKTAWSNHPGPLSVRTYPTVKYNTPFTSTRKNDSGTPEMASARSLQHEPKL